MKLWIAGVAAIAGCAWSAIARADQCAVLDDATAARAVDVLRRYPDVLSFCEPCGDVAPGVPTRIVHASARRITHGAVVVLDERSVDLAYTYVQTSSHRYENLAALVACPTSGVSPSLAIDDATTTGVLIHADPTPVRYPPHVVAATPSPPIAPPQLVAAPAPTIYVVAPPASPGVGWDVVITACGVTTGLWWLGAGLRRRRTMRPRATDL
jgi:hypothetical protein